MHYWANTCETLEHQLHITAKTNEEFYFYGILRTSKLEDKQKQSSGVFSAKD